MAYSHRPRFSAGSTDNNMDTLFQILYEAGADEVMGSHDRHYERFAPQDPNGIADPQNGIRQFLVGTGGRSLRNLSTILPNSEVSNNDTFGVLKLTLHPASYDWEFITIAGQTFTDSGSASCSPMYGN